MFIELTMILHQLEDNIRPVFVNLNNVTYMSEFKTKFWCRVDDHNEPYEQQVTSISFAAGLHEESDSINVLETLEEIDRCIQESR